MKKNSLTVKAADLVASGLGVVASPALRFLGRYHENLPNFRKVSDRYNFQIRTSRYYEPTYRDSDLPVDVTAKRHLPGLNLNLDGQLALLEEFTFGSELEALPDEKPSKTEFGFVNRFYGPGDADMAYNMIRRFKPKRVIEVGSGQSTLISKLAIDRNRSEDPAYSCQQMCIEPYEVDWLDQIGVEVIRKRIEDIELSWFDQLQENDIFLVDSSHVIRPFGDVLYEFQEIIPTVAKGVIIHVHDVFTPYPYPEFWLREKRRLWDEQYLLEAFLAFNTEFEVMAASHMLARDHFEAFAKACPSMNRHPGKRPGSFWFRRV